MQSVKEMNSNKKTVLLIGLFLIQFVVISIHPVNSQTENVTIDGWNVWVNEEWAADPYPINPKSYETIMIKTYAVTLTYSNMKIQFDIGESTQYDTNNQWWSNVTFWSVECYWTMGSESIVDCRNRFGLQDFPTTIYPEGGDPDAPGGALQKATTSVSNPKIITQEVDHTLINVNMTFADLKPKQPTSEYHFLEFDAHFAFYITHTLETTAIKIDQYIDFKSINCAHFNISTGNQYEFGLGNMYSLYYGETSLHPIIDDNNETSTYSYEEIDLGLFSLAQNFTRYDNNGTVEIPIERRIVASDEGGMCFNTILPVLAENTSGVYIDPLYVIPNGNPFTEDTSINSDGNAYTEDTSINVNIIIPAISLFVFWRKRKKNRRKLN